MFYEWILQARTVQHVFVENKVAVPNAAPQGKITVRASIIVFNVPHEMSMGLFFSSTSFISFFLYAVVTIFRQRLHGPTI